MAIECVGSVDIEVPQGACYAAASAIETWPEWARDMETLTVLERDGAGRPGRVRVVADLFGKEYDAVVDFHFDKAPDELSFGLVEARKLRALEGSLRFEPAKAGTRLNFRMLMVLLKPKASRIERMVARRIETAFERDLRRYIERGVRRR